jgi:RNA binding exosome subunit
MKKDLVHLVQFLFEGSQDYFIRDAGLILQNNSLKVVFDSDYGLPEYINVSIKEGALGNKSIVSELIESEKLKNVICDIWKKIEKNNNNEFIEEHHDEYHKFYNGFLDALQGKKENNDFIFSVEKEDNVLSINAEDKSSGITSCLSFNLINVETNIKPHNALILSAGAVVKTNADNYKWKTAEFAIYIPILDLDKYPVLELSANRKYEKDNVLDYLKEQIKDSGSKQLLSVFELQSELHQNNQDKPKKHKI